MSQTWDQWNLSSKWDIMPLFKRTCIELRKANILIVNIKASEVLYKLKIDLLTTNVQLQLKFYLNV